MVSLRPGLSDSGDGSHHVAARAGDDFTVGMDIYVMVGQKQSQLTQWAPRQELCVHLGILPHGLRDAELLAWGHRASG